MNKEKLKGYLEKAKTALGKISRKIWILIAVCLVVVVAIAAFAIHSYMNRPYAVLIDKANNEEMATVVTWLQEQGITDYKMDGSGTILVPEGQVFTLKARLLQQQYSSTNASPSGYFERVGAMSTMFDREQAKLEDLENDIEKTIRQFPGVLDVDVQINPGEDNSYILYQNNVVEASASVHLTMESGKILTTEQANAIRNYVSHAVANLEVENVSITDSVGNTYSDFSGGKASSDSVLKMQLEENYENRIRTQVMQALAKVYGGEENVIAVVNVTIELGNKTINRHEVELPEFAQDGSTGGRGVIGSEFYAYTFTTPDNGAVGGVVGTTTNADLPTYVEPGEAQAELERIMNEEANRIYDNTTTDTEMIVHCGTVEDVSIAVWIDGSLYDNPGDINVDRVRSWVAAAANIIPNITDEVTQEEYLNWKIAVNTDPFVHPEEPVDPNPPITDGTIFGIQYWVVIAAGVGLLLFIIILVTVILLVRRRKRKKQEAEQKAMEELLATAMPGQTVEIGPDGQPIVVDALPELDEEGNPVSGANVMDLHTERSMELRQSIRDFVDENMEVAALLLKSWMKEDGDNG